MFLQGVQAHWLKNGAIYSSNVTLIYDQTAGGLLQLNLPDLIITEASESANYSCQLDAVVDGNDGIRSVRSNPVQIFVFGKFPLII